ncbi:asparagine synthase (glutamine-hydrolyzing) [Thalassomonas actiniarum]|uniref:asparagine synthase (glutamine-hydrolyzing) n=1 Tax=Thalassomonas actiniarum TaxID=485447 RepID=A0AAE9YNX1_9GAMM|nr:asparagine synthase (glutamine-hydrolyzing) [Thalassomonas actiniarum]WDD98510.1 asparagine synthase (glutamine-hydrolyzing) [Thalassomonas actiniarum]
MCGIAGFWSATNKGIHREKPLDNIRRMSERLSHRGPDARGIWHDEAGIALGHSRLSIQDLSAHGHQPMLSSCQRYVLVFNGEIYNFLVLKALLEKEGLTFIGHSDTEVLLAALCHWGLDKALGLFNGMFAFALWDKQKQSLTLAQDRAAKKPLYFGWVGQDFVFASELKAFQVLSGFSGEIDKEALTLYLTYNYVPAPHSIYQNIYKLAQGACITLSADIFTDKACLLERVRHYWCAYQSAKQQYRQPFNGSYLDAVNQLDAHLVDATKIRMICDVPLGVMLSGGIDSATVTGIAQSLSSRAVNSFSIGFENNNKCEAGAARKIAGHLGTDHHELIVTGRDALDVLPLLPQMYDEPFGDSSQIPTYLVAKLAKSRVKVALTGDGGDELFYGYRRYFSSHKLTKVNRKIPGLLRRPLSQLCYSIGRLSRCEHKFLQHAQNIAASHPLDLYQSRIAKFIEPHRLVRGGKPVSLANIEQVKALEICEVEFNMMLLDYTSYLTGDILVKVDRASMAASLEARNPLLDRRIVEFAWSLPTAYKFNQGTGKTVLRDVLVRYVPDELMNRPKQGFGSPIKKWLSGPLRDWAEELLSEDTIRQQGLLEPALVRYLWEKCKANPQGRHSHLWTILMFQAWYRQQALAA